MCLDKILANARDNDVAFLVGGDPLSATTHTDLILRAVELNIPYKIVHNASIMNAIGSCGLQVRFCRILKVTVDVLWFSCTILVRLFPLFFGRTHGDQQVFVKRLLPIDDVVYILYVY